MDLIELIEAFLAAKQYAFAPNTRRAYRYDLIACARLLPTIPLTEITVSHLRLFLDATADLAPITLARRKAALRSCLSSESINFVFLTHINFSQFAWKGIRSSFMVVCRSMALPQIFSRRDFTVFLELLLAQRRGNHCFLTQFRSQGSLRELQERCDFCHNIFRDSSKDGL